LRGNEESFCDHFDHVMDMILQDTMMEGEITECQMVESASITGYEQSGGLRAAPSRA
jgi:hypothetical protein